MVALGSCILGSLMKETRPFCRPVHGDEFLAVLYSEGEPVVADILRTECCLVRPGRSREAGRTDSIRLVDTVSREKSLSALEIMLVWAFPTHLTFPKRVKLHAKLYNWIP